MRLRHSTAMFRSGKEFIENEEILPRAAVLVRHIVKPCFHDGGSRITAGHVTASIIEGAFWQAPLLMP